MHKIFIENNGNLIEFYGEERVRKNSHKTALYLHKITIECRIIIETLTEFSWRFLNKKKKYYAVVNFQIYLSLQR